MGYCDILESIDNLVLE